MVFDSFGVRIFCVVKIITERDLQNIWTKFNDYCMLIQLVAVDNHFGLRTYYYVFVSWITAIKIKVLSNMLVTNFRRMTLDIFIFFLLKLTFLEAYKSKYMIISTMLSSNTKYLPHNNRDWNTNRFDKFLSLMFS